MKAIQFFSDEYLEKCKSMTPDQILNFLDEFRSIILKNETKSKLISIKIPEPLLNAFKTKCELEAEKYQTQIKKLMKAWLGLEPV